MMTATLINILFFIVLIMETYQIRTSNRFIPQRQIVVTNFSNCPGGELNPIRVKTMNIIRVNRSSYVLDGEGVITEDLPGNSVKGIIFISNH